MLEAILGNVLYVRRSTGLGGAPIDVYKLRTMVPDAKQIGRGNDVQLDQYGKMTDDPRITKWGKILRKYWIDELPQLYNLLKGDLKLVGVRPMEMEDYENLPEDIRERMTHQKPGLLGIPYANPKTTTYEENVENTRDYLERWDQNSLRTDIYYFLKITSNILTGKARSS